VEEPVERRFSLESKSLIGLQEGLLINRGTLLWGGRLLLIQLWQMEIELWQ